ncbi:hypothetical protein AB7Y49_02285 [Providencia vermicola]|uniref:hypothetical protein n=1 Tax=Providencia TaxID=586 RepID=UPI00234B7246|nr:hypothetical protein [Providencia sp. PROV089]
MSNQHLEAVISELSARVTSQDIQIAELQKQLNDMQAAMSCEFSALSADILRVHVTLNSNEEAYQRILSTLQANYCNQ